MNEMIELLIAANKPLQKERIINNGKTMALGFFDYMQKSDFLKPIEEGDTLNDYIKHIAKEEDSVQAFINLIK